MQLLSDSIVMLRRPAQKKSYMLPKSPGLDLLGEARQAFLKKIKTFRDHETIEDFMMTLNFVQKLKLQYGPMVVQDLCKTIQYQKISSGQQIIQINKENRTFYVILSGKVSISIMIQKSKRHSVLKQKFKDEMDKINIEKSPQQNSKDLDGVEEEEEYFKLQEIKVLSQGDSFGELALIKENSKATATVTTKTDCEFGVLTRKQYHEVLGKISKNTYYEKLSFLEKVPIFKSWNTEDLKQLSYYLVLKKYQRHEYSFVEGQENSQIFIVKTGTFCLEKKHKNQTILISQLTQQELYMQLPVELKYSFSLKCEQDSSLLYEFSHYDFRKYVEYNNLEDFIQQVKQRSEWREERFNQIMIQCNQQLVIDQELKDVKSELNKTIKLYQTLKISSKESKPKNKVVKQQNSSERYQDMAQKALRRNFIIKSQESGDESDSSILPAIRKTSRPQKLWVDLIDAERSFDSLNSYQIGQSEQYNLYYKIKQNSKKQRNAVNS